jgi:transcriptional regulator with XRE-family HTH domain
MEVGRLIRLKRKAKGMTQEDVGRRVGIARKYVSELERGKFLPGTKVLVNLARCLDIDLNLLKEAGDGEKVL